MNSVAERLNSPRFQRYLLWFGVAVLAIGAAALVFVIVGGNSGAPQKADPGFHPKLPAKSIPLKNQQGVLIKTYQQLDPQIRDAVKTFQDWSTCSRATAVQMKVLTALRICGSSCW